MLDGTDRAADDVVAVVPPDLVECTVEKVAVNAVLAGCRPEYLPVVLAAVEAACTDEFNMHGLLATTMPVGPVMVVNGPIRHRIGMNDGVNVLGQGNRANATIGRALQLVIRNVGGGRPGGSTAPRTANPASSRSASPRTRSVHRGSRCTSSVASTVGEHRHAVRGRGSARHRRPVVTRSPSRWPARSPRCLRTVQHPKLAIGFDAILVVSPEHGRVFAEAGWTQGAVAGPSCSELTLLDGHEIVRGAGGITEGVPEWATDAKLPKFRPDGLLIVHAGGGAGLFSTIIGGWANGETGSQPVTREIAS